MMKNQMLFLGPPASGKGTQTERLSKELGLPHIDTGSLLRAEIAAGTEEGKIIQALIDKGHLAPAPLVAKIIIKKIFSEEAKNGYILDGYPRSMEQAELMETELEKAGVANSPQRIVVKMKVDRDSLMERIVNRRMCKKCGKIYNLKTLPPKTANVCDDCGGELYQRKDDNEEVAMQRFETYNTETAPLVDYYTKKGLLVTVDANKTPDEIYEEILKVIGA